MNFLNIGLYLRNKKGSSLASCLEMRRCVSIDMGSNDKSVIITRNGHLPLQIVLWEHLNEDCSDGDAYTSWKMN